MYSFSKYKAQYLQNLRLAFPVALSQLGQVVVQFADNAMVGRYGGDDPLPLAAAAFGNGIFFIVFITVMGLTFGITPLIGEMYAQGRSEESAKYLQNSVVLYGVVALFAMALQYALIPLFPHMGQPAEVVAMATPFYKTLVWGLLPAIVFFCFKQFLEGVGSTKLAMYTVIISNVINILFNYLLIGGKCGMPEMGVLGAGVATLISRIAMAVILVSYLFRSRRFQVYRHAFARENHSWQRMKELFRMGLPISMQIFLEVTTFVFIGLMFGWLGTSAISANQISTTMGNSSFMLVVAMGAATTIRISHCLGERDIPQMRLAAEASAHLTLVWGVLICAVYYLLRNVIPLIFTTNAEVIELTSTLLLFVAAYQIPDGLQCIGVGIMRGMQDVRIIPLIAFFSYWVCNMPIAYLCAFRWGMGAEGLYVGYIISFIVAAGLMYLRIKSRLRGLSAKYM